MDVLKKYDCSRGYSVVFEDTDKLFNAESRFHQIKLDSVWILELLVEKHIEYNKPLIRVFIDYEKVFKSVNQGKLFEALLECRINSRYAEILKYIYPQAHPSVKVQREIKRFNVERGECHENIVSPKLSLLHQEHVQVARIK